MVVPYLPQHEAQEPQSGLAPGIPPFAGLVGRQHDFIVDQNDLRNDKVLQVADAAPWMTLEEIFDLRGFLSPDLWKFASLECIGALSEALSVAR
jgi:hypothetical protein